MPGICQAYARCGCASRAATDLDGQGHDIHTRSLRVVVAVEEKRASDILSVRVPLAGQAVQTHTISLSLPQYKTKDQEAVRQH